MSSRTAFSDALQQAARIHELLVERARATDPDDPDAVLNLAAAVIMHGLLESTAVFANARFVTAELRGDLEAEHAALCDAMSLIGELADDPAGESDLHAVCVAVHDKIVRHVERDERVIYGSLARLEAFSAPKAGK